MKVKKAVSGGGPAKVMYQRVGAGPSPLTALFTFISRQIYIFEVINPHTVGSLTIPRASIKWV